jgi:hypothetical protein
MTKTPSIAGIPEPFTDSSGYNSVSANLDSPEPYPHPFPPSLAGEGMGGGRAAAA